MKALLSALLCLFISSSFADDLRYYDVEIIVIENQSEGATESEHWPLAVSIEKQANTVTLGELPSREWLPLDANLEHSFKILPADEFQLNAEVEKISESRTQRVIFHTAWRQPGLVRNISMPVYIKHVVTDFPLDAIEEEPLEAVQEEAPLVVESEAPVIAEGEVLETTIEEATDLDESNLDILEGTFRVSLSRFLHLEAELIYKTKAKEAEDSTFESIELEENLEQDQETQPKQQGIIYFKQKRNRIRSNELHYLDHPVLSILIRITRFEIPEEDLNPAPILNQL